MTHKTEQVKKHGTAPQGRSRRRGTKLSTGIRQQAVLQVEAILANYHPCYIDANDDQILRKRLPIELPLLGIR